jgi:hypothetical protein
MRNIKKKITVKTVVRYYYDRTTKEEKSDTVEIAEDQEAPALPPNCFLIENEAIYEKQVVYTMSPETFIKYATPDEK